MTVNHSPEGSDTLTHIARAGTTLADHYADQQAAPREVWVVVTRAYRVPAGHAVDFANRAREPHALCGLAPVHTEVGIRHALDTHRVNPHAPRPTDHRPA